MKIDPLAHLNLVDLSRRMRDAQFMGFWLATRKIILEKTTKNLLQDYSS